MRRVSLGRAVTCYGYVLMDNAARPIWIGADSWELAEVDLTLALSPDHMAASSPNSIEESGSDGGELPLRRAEGAIRRSQRRRPDWGDYGLMKSQASALPENCPGISIGKVDESKATKFCTRKRYRFRAERAAEPKTRKGLHPRDWSNSAVLRDPWLNLENERTRRRNRIVLLLYVGC